MKVTKINESFSWLEGNSQELKQIHEFLKVEVDNANFDPLIKRGFKSRFEYFSYYDKEKTKLCIFNGHLKLLEKFNVEYEKETFFTDEEIQEYLDNVKLPYKLYDYQENIVKDSLKVGRQINVSCTSSGKSLSIACICDFLRTKNLKGLLLVPNINLLTQFKSDIESYHLTDLLNEVEILGDGNVPTFKKKLLISTWQSLDNHRDKLDFDYLIGDEGHRYSAKVSTDIIKNLVKTKIRLCFTGTFPDSQVSKMTLLGLFGMPKTFIRAHQLIERGLGTPITIRSIIFEYNNEFKSLLRSTSNYSKLLKLIKEKEERNNIIVKLACKLREQNENTLVLFSHTEHGKDLFLKTMKQLFPNVVVENKDITGKKSFEFQKQYKVFFLNGEDDSKTRELTRKILEEEEGTILIACYPLLSTGVNIRQLHNMILASPLKSYTTITQSIGRLMRKHPKKQLAKVFDLVDDLGVRTRGGVFFKQYLHRLQTSYNPEGYNIQETVIKI